MWQDFDKVRIPVNDVPETITVGLPSAISDEDGSGILEREEVDSLLLSPQVSTSLNRAPHQITRRFSEACRKKKCI